MGCYEGNGATYTGGTSTTVNGKVCQMWALDSPHSHGYNSLPFNYCRNPDGEPWPWCYTTDPNTRWEACSQIPQCPDPPSAPPIPPQPMPPPAPSMYVCEGPVGGDTHESTLTSGGAGDGVRIISHPEFDFIDDSPITSGPCSWFVTPAGGTLPGLHQGPTTAAVAGVNPVPGANAWGNAPGDNTLMGCNAIYKNREYTDFIMEVDVASFDNDGVGFNFGVRGTMCGAPGTNCQGSSRYTAIMINDRWPSPAADGVGGPHFKIKMQNGRDCLGSMTAANNCFDTLAYLNNDGHFASNAPASGMAGTDRVRAQLPAPYAATYQPYPRSVKMVLIVKDREARAYWRDPTTGVANAVKAQLPTSYTGGKVGFFTYAHTGRFTNLKITDIGSTASSSPTGYCDGTATCMTGLGLCGARPPPNPPPPPFPPPKPLRR
jgi:hypothetical protein